MVNENDLFNPLIFAHIFFSTGSLGSGNNASGPDDVSAQDQSEKYWPKIIFHICAVALVFSLNLWLQINLYFLSKNLKPSEFCLLRLSFSFIELGFTTAACVRAILRAILSNMPSLCEYYDLYGERERARVA